MRYLVEEAGEVVFRTDVERRFGEAAISQSVLVPFCTNQIHVEMEEQWPEPFEDPLFDYEHL